LIGGVIVFLLGGGLEKLTRTALRKQ
jgi:hypothetical protein